MEKCDEEIRAILDQCSYYPTALTLKAQRLYDKKNYSKAIKVLQKLVTLQNKNEQKTSFEYMKECYTQLGERKKKRQNNYHYFLNH